MKINKYLCLLAFTFIVVYSIIFYFANVNNLSAKIIKNIVLMYIIVIFIKQCTMQTCFSK